MAHFAKIDSETGLVLEVNVVNNSDILDLSFPDSEPVGIEFLIPWGTPGTYWKQTSYNGNFRKNYAGIGYTYDTERDAFIPPKPFNSWVLNEDTCLWEPPVPYPTDIGTPENPKHYTWDEYTTSWILLGK